jgi:hypothetical protein
MSFMSPNQPSLIRLSHYKCLVYACHDIMVGSARIVLLIIEKEGKFSLWKKLFFAVAVCWRQILGRISGAGFHDGSAHKSPQTQCDNPGHDDYCRGREHCRRSPIAA